MLLIGLSNLVTGNIYDETLKKVCVYVKLEIKYMLQKIRNESR